MKKDLFILIFSLFALFAQAQTVEIEKIASTATPAAGTSFTYTLNFRCASILQDCESVTITDVIPTGLNYVGASSSLGGTPVYDAGNRTLTVSFNRGSTGNGLTAGDAGQVTITCIVPANTAPSTVFDNTGVINSNNAGTDFSMISVTSTGGSVGTPGISMFKQSSGSVSPGGNASFSLVHGNTGNTLISNYVVEDCLPMGIFLNSLDISAFQGSNNTATVEYKTTSNPSTWQTWTTFNTGTGTILDVSSLSLTLGDAVTCVKLSYGDLPGNGTFTPSPASAIKINVFADNTVVDGTNITNCASNSGGSYTANSCADLFVQAPSDKLFSYKSLPSGPFATGQQMDFYTGLVFPASNVTPASGIVITDLLPAGFTYVAGSGTPGGNGWVAAGSIAPVETIITNFAGTGRTLIRWSWTTATGNNVTIPTAINDQLFGLNLKAIPSNPGTGVRNCIYASVENSTYFKYIDNPTIDTNDYDGDGNTSETLTSACATFDVVGIALSAGLESIKLVKGQLDANYSQYPAFGFTVQGGLADYKLQVKNPNSITMKDIKIIDILPFIGDVGVIDPTARATQWRPNLAGPVVAPSGVTVYYSTVQNPCRDEMKQPSDPSPFPAGCTAANWTTTLPNDITTVQSLKFDFGTLEIGAGQQLELNWPMRAPVNAATNDEIAWNSFGFASTRADNNQPLLPSEPIKVGIKVQAPTPAIYGDKVWLDTNRDGIQDAGENGVDGVKVTLYKSDNTELGFTITANGGLYLFPNLELGDYYAIFSNLPAGFVASPPNQGGDSTLNSDGVDNGGGTYKTAVTSLSILEDDRTWDLGINLFVACTPPTAGTNTSAAGTCTGATANNDAKIDFTGITNADKAGIVEGTTYVGTNYASTTGVVTAGATSFTGLKHATQYTVRIFNATNDCFVDVTITTLTKNCCPTITTPSSLQTLCVGIAGANITVQSNQNAANSIKFVKFTSDQSTTNGNETLTELTNIYAGASTLATVTPTGASSPYTATYTWNLADFPNATGSVITYYVYAILNPDAGASCRPVQEIKVVVNPLPTFTISSTNVTCKGGNDGTITVGTPTTGTAPFEYSKDGGSNYQGSNIFTTLIRGSYQVAVKDSNGCVKICQ